MKSILWALLFVLFAASASAHYKLMFSRAAVELYLSNDTYVAHAIRTDAFSAPEHILTAGCSPASVQSGPHTTFSCYAEISDAEQGRYLFVVSPPVPIGAFPDVHVAHFTLLDNFSSSK
jgi:hypothetical protein